MQRIKPCIQCRGEMEPYFYEGGARLSLKCSVCKFETAQSGYLNSHDSIIREYNNQCDNTVSLKINPCLDCGGQVAIFYTSDKSYRLKCGNCIYKSPVFHTDILVSVAIEEYNQSCEPVKQDRCNPNYFSTLPSREEMIKELQEVADEVVNICPHAFTIKPKGFVLYKRKYTVFKKTCSLCKKEKIWDLIFSDKGLHNDFPVDPHRLTPAEEYSPKYGWRSLIRLAD